MRGPAQQHSSADYVELGNGRRARLIEPIGRGASSTVFRAVLESASGLERCVALKLFGGFSSDETDRVSGRVALTAQRLAAARHPNIVELYDFGWRGTQPFFVTELVEGVSLHALLERYHATSRRLPLDVALFIASETAEALAGARLARDARNEQMNLLHHALGTRKVLLGLNGQVKVTDFETSLATSASSSVRSLSSVTHRTATMAPEVAMGESGDERSDVFSLGVVMREIFVGPRFASSLSNAEAVRLAREGFIEPVSFQPNLPSSLTELMEHALAIDPEHRYPSANALAFDLRRVALAMGVGDGRMFLRRALDRDWGSESEVTRDHHQPHIVQVAQVVQVVQCEDLDSLPTVTTLGPEFGETSSSDGLLDPRSGE